MYLPNLTNMRPNSPAGHFRRYLPFIIFGVLLFRYFQFRAPPSTWRSQVPDSSLAANIQPVVNNIPEASDGRKALQPSCSPEQWSDGEWIFKPHKYTKPVTTQDDMLAYAGLESLPPGLDMRIRLGWEPEWIRNQWPVKTAWRWKPSRECRINPFNKEEVVRHLVENGGWYMIGDSNLIERWHALGCMLHPHIVNTNGDKWPMHFHLNPNSSLIPTLKFPEGFDIKITPLLTTQRVDLLFNFTELEHIYHERYAPAKNFVLMNGPPVTPSYSSSPTRYMPMFNAPLPHGGYSTLVATTGGHWSGCVFTGLKDLYNTNEFGPELMSRVLDFMETAAIPTWAQTIEEWLVDYSRHSETNSQSHKIQKRVIVLSSVTGHPECKNQLLPWKEYDTTEAKGPLKYMHKMNPILKSVIDSGRYPSMSYLGIERPGLLRPDAHLGVDCQHMLTGVGVMEGEMHYLFHHLQYGLNSSRVGKKHSASN